MPRKIRPTALRSATFDFSANLNANPVEIAEHHALMRWHEGKTISTGFGGGLVLDFADDGSGSHACFIMVLVVLRIGQSLVLIGGRGTYVGTKNDRSRERA
jgi:hypothetical protein